jgi:hypothetical protein
MTASAALAAACLRTRCDAEHCSLLIGESGMGSQDDVSLRALFVSRFY